MPIKRIDTDLLTALAGKAAASPRLRTNHNLHPTLGDPVQRFLNAMQPGTYVRPHRHTDPARWELFLVLRGHVAILLFDEQGRVSERLELSDEGPVHGVEIEPGCWHTLVALAPSVLFELKQGPYSALTDKDFCSWAPAEGEPSCAPMLAWYQRARVGDRVPENLVPSLQAK